MIYLLHVIVLIGIFAILSTSLNLVAGHAGLLSMAHGAFFGIGAYTSALLSLNADFPFWAAFATSMAAGCALSVLVSGPSLRLREDYFVIAAFGFQLIVSSVFNNWVGLTRGPQGIGGIPRPRILGWNVDSQVAFALLSLTLAGASIAVVGAISRSAFGRVLRSIREDEILSQACGKSTVRTKVAAFAVSAALAAAAGSLYAHYISFIDPTGFTVMDSILILAMVIIGGAGGLFGPALGAAILVVFPEALRFVGLPGYVAGHLRQVMYGTALVLFVVLRPRGIVVKNGARR